MCKTIGQHLAKETVLTIGLVQIMEHIGKAVEKNQTIHFAHPGNQLVWKMQLIGSSAVSWWVSLEYATSYQSSGDWTSQKVSTGTNVGKVRAVWSGDEPSSTSIEVMVSNDNGSTWEGAENNVEVSSQLKVQAMNCFTR